ncbi:MAG: ribonuclease HII [Parachlamydiales bacterium]|jgi:ribonuclease HII
MDFSAVERKRLQEMSKIENSLYQQGYRIIAGVDEAGRGPLAGPVVAAACILPKGFLLKDLNDSKKLSAAQRNRLFAILTGLPEVVFGLGIVETLTIDRINILQATFQAMQQAVLNLIVLPEIVLVDGSLLPVLAMKARAVVKGDRLSLSIAAASVIAKKTRDDLMDGYDRQWPEYAFQEHKGYGTKKHLENLAKYGPSPIHRRSFAPLKNQAVSPLERTL